MPLCFEYQGARVSDNFTDIMLILSSVFWGISRNFWMYILCLLLCDVRFVLGNPNMILMPIMCFEVNNLYIIYAMSLTLIELIPISVNKKKELRTFGINIHSTPKPNLKDIRKNIHKVDFHLTQTNEKNKQQKMEHPVKTLHRKFSWNSCCPCKRSRFLENIWLIPRSYIAHYWLVLIIWLITYLSYVQGSLLTCFNYMTN